MAPTILQLRPNLNAAAYLIEIMVAEALFLKPYKKKENFTVRYIASALLLLVLGTLTRIPALAGFPRFLWFFAAMADCIAAACFYAILCCVFALIIQFTVTKWQQADTERLLTAQLFSESKKQYEQWSVNAGMIKHWIHDLRHLMDRIELQCVAYADCLKYFDGMKLYFLFANAIDNAMEGVSGIEDPEKRLIDISIRAFGDSASIHIWNYFSGPITFSSGLPVTNKSEESHGFGMKSMQRIVDEFDGVMHAHTEGEIFNLDIMLPVPEVMQ